MASEKQLATPLRAVLVDDEPLIRKRFRQMLSHHPDVSIVGEAASAAEAVAVFAEVDFDLAFLDVVMPEANGFSLISRVPPTAAVVFVTAHERFARQAFDVAATDYLLKPVDPDRLAECLRRVRARLATQWASEQILVAEGDRTRRVTAAEIVAVEQAGDAAVLLHIARDVAARVSGRVGEWAERLQGRGLERVSRSLLLRPEAIVHLERLSRNEMLVELAGVAKTFRLGRTAAVRVNRLVSGSPQHDRQRFPGGH
jgi:two-component system LytT family response regulator